MTGGAFCVLSIACASIPCAAAAPARRAAPRTADTLMVLRDVKITMRLGAPLRARIYRLSGKSLRPAVFSLERDTSEVRDRDARALAAAGYAVVIAAPRGGDDKHVGRDGYDAVEWINDQSWSDRRIVMAGTGEGANAAWNAAREHPEHLAAILARTPARPLGWSETDVRRTWIPALSIAGSAGSEQGTAIETDSVYASTTREGGVPSAYLVIGTLSDEQLADLEREWFDWAVGRGPLPPFLRKRVNYLSATDSTWRAAASFFAIAAVPTSFPLHTNAGPHSAPGGFLGDAARDDEPADTVPAEGKPYETLVGKTLEIVGRPSVTLWLDQPPATGLEVSLDQLLADGRVIPLGNSVGKLVPVDTAAPPPAHSRRWDFQAFPWTARTLELGTRLRLTVRGGGSVIYHDVERYSRVILPAARVLR